MEPNKNRNLRKKLLTIVPATIFAIVMIASLILGLAFSGGTGPQPSNASGTTTQTIRTVVEVIVIPGSTTFTTTITQNQTRCTGSPIVIVRPEVIIQSSTTITTTVTYTTAPC